MDKQLLTGIAVLALTLSASPAQADVLACDGAPNAIDAPDTIDVRQSWSPPRTCVITRRGNRWRRVCRVQRRGPAPAWLDGANLRAEIPRGLDRGGIPPSLDNIPEDGEDGAPLHPRITPPALSLPDRHGPPAIVLPRRDLTPPLRSLPAPYTSRARPAPSKKAPSKKSAVTPRRQRVDVVTLTKREAQALRQLDLARKRRGLAALRIDPIAVRVARAHSADMCRKHYFDHRGPDGSAPWDRLRKAGARFSAAAENIAVGYTTGLGVHKGWMNSPGHRNNRMNGRYRRVGIGAADCSGRPYWTELFLR